MKNKDIKISVIIPMYNREKTIIRCLDSVIQQTYPPYEIIVVDDGSTDNGIGKVQELQKDFIKIFRQDHKGAQTARNRGIVEAVGEWIAFLDSDDEWDIHKLEKQIARIKNVDEDILIYTDGNKKTGERIELMGMPAIEGNAYKEILKHSFVLFQSILVKKSCLEKIGYLDEKIVSFQEWDTSIRLAKICKFIYIDEPLFIWNRDDAGNTISGNDEKYIQGMEYIITKYKKEMLQYVGKQCLRKHYRELFWFCWNRKDKRKWCYLKQMFRGL